MHPSTLFPFKRASRLFPLLGAIATLIPLTTALAGVKDEGGSVVVAYNKRMSGSKGVAEYYAKLRGIPDDQIIGLDTRTDETIPRWLFESEIREPLAAQFARRGLWKMGEVPVRNTNGAVTRTVQGVVESKVRYLVLCYGMPLRIESTTNLTEKGMENLRPEVRINNAAVDSELALLPFARAELTLSGPAMNPLYSTTNAAMLNPTNGLLMVARLDGPSAEIARGLVDKAIQAETNGLWGRAYFDLRGITNGAYALGDRWISTAAEVSALAGFETAIDTLPGTLPRQFPLSHVALYAGWYSASVDGPFALNVIEFVPGAVAYHLHSFSAPTLRSRTVGWAGPFIAKGATATLGTVWEPYLSGTPDVGVVFARFILQGFTFGESAYAGSMMLSWMTTVVGDPLYRPFGTDLKTQFEQLAARQSPDAAWALLRMVNLNLARGASAAEASAFIENLPDTKRSSVLLEKVGDLFVRQGKPSSAVLNWKQALTLETGLQQRIRLELKLAPKLAELDRQKEAFDVYRDFLKRYPDYADRLGVLRQAVPLATAQDASLAAAWQAEIQRLSPPPPPPVVSNAPAAPKP